MAYVLNLFTPETWRAFRGHGADVTGFSRGHLSRARNLVRPGDRFLCYVVGVSRWAGVLEVLEGPYEDDTPIFTVTNDPWVIRFKVAPIVQLDFEQAIPIQEQFVWKSLDRTKHIEPHSVGWGVRAGLQGSLVSISDQDGSFLEEQLRNQSETQHVFPLDESDLKRLAKNSSYVQTSTGAVNVTIPQDDAEEIGEVIHGELEPAVRESIAVQAHLVEIGSKMGFSSWVPRGDRARVSEQLSEVAIGSLLIGQLPLNYNDATLRTIENIDVLWMKNRSIVRAFEVEHTTAIYSGLLRMADLLALQPNIDIKLHIVAPDDRREKVLGEIRRPVFTLLEKGPLAESCSFLSYTAIETLYGEPKLAYLRDSYLEELEEYAEIL